jgi:transforming growth factor-beta-induced protein
MVASSAAATKNIVQLAVATPDLSTLVTALEAGKLTDALSGTGPFTVFAPTNEAFAKVPASTLAHLLDPANIKELDAVLEYHVIAGAAVFAKDLKPTQEVKTLEGDELKIVVNAGRVTVNGAAVTAADNAASNGVVHIIDGVLSLPAPATKNIVQLAQSVPDLSTLVTALVAGKLTGALSGAGPFTVFAPTNEAFAKVPAATLANLLDPANIKELDAVLEYHVIAGAAVFAKDLKPFQMVKTLEGDELKIVKAGRVLINNATVVAVDNAATNGVVHIIDGVLIPPAAPAPAPSKSIVDLAIADPDLSTLVAALKAADLVNTLSGPGPFNVFTPTNEAFATLPAGVLTNLLKPENKAQLVDLLTYHVSKGNVDYPTNLQLQ